MFFITSVVPPSIELARARRNKKRASPSYGITYEDEMPYQPSITMVDMQLNHATKAALPSPKTAGARFSYFISVEEHGRDAAVATYLLQVAYQTNRGAEIEPAAVSGVNDTIATPDLALSPFSTNTFVFGDHQLSADADGRHLETLGGLVRSSGAELGVLFDSPGERVRFVDGSGRLVDRTTALLAFVVWWSFIVGHVLNNIRGFEI